MTRKPIFWGLFALASVVAAALAFQYFPRAFPIVTLDLQMDREAALEAAEALAGERAWGPEPFRQAASFRVDDRVQAFVELEAGGNDAFARMMEEGHYAPYTWRVRHFREGEPNHTTMVFTPTGSPYGFREALAEDQPGAALGAEEARALAEAIASGEWGLDLEDHDLVEQGQELRPGGRVDHTLVYERTGVVLGDGRYRLRLVVGGDRLTELSHLVQVPEAFERRYEEMRSANSAVALGGTLGMILLLVGGIVGLFFLLRQRRVLWRQPLAWGFFVSLLVALTTLNHWPLLWMGYDTAVSARNFALQHVLVALGALLGLGALYTAIYMAAESLSRRAFPHHVQLWRIWSPRVAATPAVLGRTVAAFLLVPLFWGYQVALYFSTREALGWWNPSGALFQPDALATYFPWLTSIAISLQAGFWEECLFRAVPLAGAALLGERFGGRRWWILGALLLQAVVFGAAHAEYPAQPAYARLVELILPSVGFGLIYLGFGLLPAILLHFAFNVSAFSVPLFVSEAPGAWINQAMVLLLALVPLWVVLAARFRSGAWKEVPEDALNRAWAPPPPREAPPAPAIPREERLALPSRARWVALGLGVAGLATWLLAAPFGADAPPLEVSRAEAVAKARQALAERDVELPEPWREMPHVQAPLGEPTRFVWQEGGEGAYRQLLGEYLPVPRWRVRYARFEGDVVERAEEHQVFVGPTGELLRFRHLLPEGREGASLSEEEARLLAQSTARERYRLEPADFEEVSAVPTRRPERTDWAFTFRVPRDNPLATGEARVVVEIAGGEVSDAYRTVHVPEEWSRQARNERTLRTVVTAVCWILLVLAFLAGAVVAIIAWSRRAFSARAFLVAFALLAVTALLQTANSWPQAVSGFSTAQPFGLQAAALAFGGLMLLLVAAVVALALGVSHTWARERRGPRSAGPATGLALGAAAAGLLAAAGRLGPSEAPLWGSYQSAGTWIPLLSEGITPLGSLVARATLLLLALVTVDRLTDGWRQRRPLGAAALAVLGLAMAGTGDLGLASWAIAGILMALVLVAAYALVLRFDLALVPLAVGAALALERLQQGLLGAHAMALPGAVVSALLILATALLWHSSLARAEAAPSQS